MNLINEIMNAKIMISEEDAAKIYKMISKKNAVGKIVDLTKIKERSKPHQFYVYINRKQYTGKTLQDLIDTIYQEFCAEKDSLLSLYPDMMRYKKDVCQSSAKTLKEYSLRWETLKQLNIITMPIKEITAKDLIAAFRELLNKKPMTASFFRDHKSVLSAIFTVAIEKDIVQTNPLQSINYQQFNFKVPNSEKEILSPAERKILLNHLKQYENDIYALAAQFDLCVLARIAEIKSLKWDDIKGNCIKIQRQLVDHQTLNDDLTFNVCKHTELQHVKGKKKQGIRMMPLIPTAKNILEKAKRLNPNGEYIFMQKDKVLTTVTFNRHLAKYCSECGLPDISSHDIRFSVASAMFQEGVKPTVLQGLLGHTTLATTMRYLKNTESLEETASKMCAILQ